MVTVLVIGSEVFLSKFLPPISRLLNEFCNASNEFLVAYVLDTVVWNPSIVWTISLILCSVVSLSNTGKSACILSTPVNDKILTAVVVSASIKRT